MNEIKIVFQSFVEGVDLYKKLKFRGKKIIPLSLMLILFLTYMFLGDKFSEFLILLVKKQMKTSIFTDTFIVLIGKIFTFIVYFYTYKYIVLGIISPFLGLFSEKSEEFYQGKNYKFGILKNIKFIFRGIGISTINFGIELMFTFFFFFLGILLPFKGVFYAITFIIQSFFIAYSFLDYTLERREFGIKNSIKEAFRNFLPLSIIGLLFMLFFIIPVIGVLYGPFYFTGVVTLYYLKKEKIS